jgi:hypothetical protein
LLLHPVEPFEGYFHATQQENHARPFYAVRKRAEEIQLASANVLFLEMWPQYQQSLQELKLFCWNTYGQVFTPFCSSALNHQPTILCSHPYQKTVGTLA